MPNDAATSEELVTYESKDRIANITINRADKMNALSSGVVIQMRDAMIRLQQSDDMCAIVTATGDRAFSVGADLRDRVGMPVESRCESRGAREAGGEVAARLRGQHLRGKRRRSS